MTAPRRALTSLSARLLASYLAVIVAGGGTLLVATNLAAPRFFQAHMGMMRGGIGPGPGGMMGMPGEMAAQIGQAFAASIAEASLLAGVAALIMAVIVSLFVSRRLTVPVGRLATASRRIAAGKYDERVPTGGPDELDQLATSFNEMAAELEHAEQRRLELIGDVAHELRTPISTIEGYLEGLLDGVVEPSERTWAILQAEARRLRRLTEDLQQLSRAEAGQLELVCRKVDPLAIVRATVDRLRPDFEAQGLELQEFVAPNLPQVQADPDRAVQALSNLLTNALRYTTAPGRVEVAVSRAEAAVRFRVTDTGVGISAEHLPYVFERFYRVDKSRSRAMGGAGVGLTIARAFVEAMGGRIWAESPGPGQGATFTFELPLAR